LIVVLFPVFGADSEDLADRSNLQDFVGGYINAALDLDCWQHDGSTRKVGDIIKLEKYHEQEEKRHEQKQQEGYGRIIFIKDDAQANLDDPNNLYVKILETDSIGTNVKKNILTFILKDLFTEDSVDLYLKTGKLSLAEKESQKTGVFWDTGKANEKQWFSKKYHDTRYSYMVKYVIAHELIHFMQNKQGDSEKLILFSKCPDEQTIIQNIELLDK